MTEQELAGAKKELARLKTLTRVNEPTSKKSARIVGGEQLTNGAYRYVLISPASIGSVGEELEFVS